MSNENINVLHIYGPKAWHESPFVVGNRKGLETLRDAINEALKKAKPGQKGSAIKESMINDGEGFSLHVTCIDEDWQHPDWIKMGVPYSSDVARENREEAKMPWNLLIDQKLVKELDL